MKKIKLYPWQKRIINAIKNNEKVYFYLPRKSGLKTITEWCIKNKISYCDNFIKLDGFCQ